jgi:hypothetical protein
MLRKIHSKFGMLRNMLLHVMIDVMRGKSHEKHVLRSVPKRPFEASGAD